MSSDDHSPSSIASTLSSLKIELDQDERQSQAGVELFAQATISERNGQLAQAIGLYRRAFSLEPNAEQLFFDAKKSDMEREPCENLKSDEPDAEKPVDLRILFKERLASAGDISHRLGLLKIPKETILKILGILGSQSIRSLLNASAINCSFYLLAHENRVWREVYECLFSRPSVPMLSSSCSHFETMVRSEPRIRTDGIYICKLTYFRPGQTDIGFNQPVHLITYYRYLRFFGPAYERGSPAISGGGLGEIVKDDHNPLVLSYVTTESPKDVINLLRTPPDPDILSRQMSRHTPTLSNAGHTGLCMGRYSRIGDGDDFCLLLKDTHALHGLLFEMHLKLSAPTSITRMQNIISPSRLICTSYRALGPSSRQIAHETNIEYDVHEWRNFIFSRVKSYYT